MNYVMLICEEPGSDASQASEEAEVGDADKTSGASCDLTERQRHMSVIPLMRKRERFGGNRDV